MIAVLQECCVSKDMSTDTGMQHQQTDVEQDNFGGGQATTHRDTGASAKLLSFHLCCIEQNEREK